MAHGTCALCGKAPRQLVATSSHVEQPDVNVAWAQPRVWQVPIYVDTQALTTQKNEPCSGTKLAMY